MTHGLRGQQMRHKSQNMTSEIFDAPWVPPNHGGCAMESHTGSRRSGFASFSASHIGGVCFSSRNASARISYVKFCCLKLGLLSGLKFCCSWPITFVMFFQAGCLYLVYYYYLGKQVPPLSFCFRHERRPVSQFFQLWLHTFNSAKSL